MPHSNKWASGRYSNAVCDRCGVRTKYIDLRGETIRGKSTGLLVCPVCWDPDHPQNFLDRYVVADGQALRHARPDTGLTASRTIPSGPYPPGSLYPPGNWINGHPPASTQAAPAGKEKTA
jgi:hypothetical protein